MVVVDVVAECGVLRDLAKVAFIVESNVELGFWRWLSGAHFTLPQGLYRWQCPALFVLALPVLVHRVLCSQLPLAQQLYSAFKGIPKAFKELFKALDLPVKFRQHHVEKAGSQTRTKAGQKNKKTARKNRAKRGGVRPSRGGVAGDAAPTQNPCNLRLHRNSGNSQKFTEIPQKRDAGLRTSQTPGWVPKAAKSANSANSAKAAKAAKSCAAQLRLTKVPLLKMWTHLPARPDCNHGVPRRNIAENKSFINRFYPSLFAPSELPSPSRLSLDESGESERLETLGKDGVSQVQVQG